MIPTMTIKSNAKAPGGHPVRSRTTWCWTEWVVTSARTDGGTVTSPVWRNYYNVYVPGGGTRDPAELPDLARGVPAASRRSTSSSLRTAGSTGRPARTTSGSELSISVYGKTIAGRKVSLTFPVDHQVLLLPCGVRREMRETTMKQKMTVIVALVLGLAGVLAGCSSDSPTAPKPSPTPAAYSIPDRVLRQLGRGEDGDPADRPGHPGWAATCPTTRR